MLPLYITCKVLNLHHTAVDLVILDEYYCYQ